MGERRLCWFTQCVKVTGGGSRLMLAHEFEPRMSPKEGRGTRMFCTAFFFFLLRLPPPTCHQSMSRLPRSRVELV